MGFSYIFNIGWASPPLSPHLSSLTTSPPQCSSFHLHITRVWLFNWILSFCLCHMHTWVGMGTHVCTCGCQRLASDVFLHLLFLFLRQVLSLNVELTILVGLAGQRSQDPSTSISLCGQGRVGQGVGDRQVRKGAGHAVVCLSESSFLGTIQ